jgi:hypothetical protein
MQNVIPINTKKRIPPTCEQSWITVNDDQASNKNHSKKQKNISTAAANFTDPHTQGRP